MSLINYYDTKTIISLIQVKYIYINQDISSDIYSQHCSLIITIDIVYVYKD